MSAKFDRIPSLIHTYTGRSINPLDLKPEDVDILDIAHALSNQCRFSGHTREFYSVAQHAVLVSYVVERGYEWDALHHDDAEYALQDMAKPLKSHETLGQAYRGAEKRIEKVIGEVFDVRFPFPEQVKKADIIMLVTEARDLMHGTSEWTIHRDVEPLKQTIDPWSPRRAKREFLARYRKLKDQRGAV